MRSYQYIGPAHLLESASTAATGENIHSAADAAAWIARHEEDAGPYGLTPATFIIDGDGALRLAARRSEHVHCAQGRPVRSAGEMFLCCTARGVIVEQVTNQSTGYAPEPASWPAVAAALDRLEIPRPDGFDPAFDFRRCPACRQLCLIKEQDFICAVCGNELPAEWNLVAPVTAVRFYDHEAVLVADIANEEASPFKTGSDPDVFRGKKSGGTGFDVSLARQTLAVKPAAGPAADEGGATMSLEALRKDATSLSCQPAIEGISHPD